MPRRIAVECTCARCTRVWYADYDPAKGEAETVSLELTVRGPGGMERKIQYDALCDVCAKAVAGHVEQIDKKMEKASPNRKPRAKEEAPKGAPATPTPTPTSLTTPVPATNTAAPLKPAGASLAPSGTAGASARVPSTGPGPQSTGQKPS